jgi:hypothetical protein
MKKKLVMIRHDTQFPSYRRAGLCFGKESKPYEVTEEQLEVLRKDPRIVMHEVKTPKK